MSTADLFVDDHPPSRNIESSILIWFDESDDYDQNSLHELRNIVNCIYTFKEIDACVDFITDVENERMFLIISNSFVELLVPVLENVSQIDSIYVTVAADSQSAGQLDMHNWRKVKGVFTEINQLSQSLRRDIRLCDYNMASISIMRTLDGPDHDLNVLDQSFMYSQLLKDILLGMDYNDEDKKKFVAFCRLRYHDSRPELKVIDEFDRDYCKHSSIWWYTRDCFLYHMLNRALRTQDVGVIIKMGFILRDIHEQIRSLQAEAPRGSIPSTVYRGQGMIKTETEKLKANKGGLLAFNSFVSTSSDRPTSFMFAESAAQNADLNGILFQITIDPSINSTPFASLNGHGYFPEEEEILFSMHPVFRIGDMKQLEGEVLQVDLTLTRDDDPQLRILTEYLRNENARTPKWLQLSRLLVKLGKFDKAEEIHRTTRHSLPCDDPQTLMALSHELGIIKAHQGDYPGALLCVENAASLARTTIEVDYSILFRIYGHRSLLHEQMGNQSLALASYEETIAIHDQHSLPHDVFLAHIYNNIGNLHRQRSEYETALSFYEKVLEIYQTVHPENHPDFATTYDCIGDAYRCLGKYRDALTSFRKALYIRQKHLPPEHPALATVYHNIATLYQNTRDFPRAIFFYEKALDIEQQSLHPLHPELAITYLGLGCVYNDMNDYSQGLGYSEKALEILQKTSVPNHRGIAVALHNIAFAHHISEDYSTALSLYQQTLDIQLESLPPYHTELARTYTNMGCCKSSTKENISALKLFQKALDIRQKTLPPNHPSLALTSRHMALSCHQTGDYSKALSLYERALEIALITPSYKEHDLAAIRHSITDVQESMERNSSIVLLDRDFLNPNEKPLPNGHLDLSDFYETIGEQHRSTGKYNAAILYLKRALAMKTKSLPPTHPRLSYIQRSIGVAYNMLKDYRNALIFFHQALRIDQISSPADEYGLSVTYNNLADIHSSLGEYSLALFYAQKALTIRERILPPDHSSLGTIYNNIGALYKTMKDYPNALFFWQEALCIYRKILPKHHPMLNDIYLKLTHFYTMLGDDEAVSFYKQFISTIDQTDVPKYYTL